jgi:hypothetical protein
MDAAGDLELEGEAEPEFEEIPLPDGAANPLEVEINTLEDLEPPDEE